MAVQDYSVPSDARPGEAKILQSDNRCIIVSG